MKALIDGDVLVYEVGFGSQYRDEGGETIVNPFDSCISLLEQKIHEICEESWADGGVKLYLTGDSQLRDKINKRRSKDGLPLIKERDNFRVGVATTKVYKGIRSSPKPFHFDNIRAYILAKYDHHISWGWEADDQLSIDHRLDPDNTIICSRDKDLRITPGRHFGWACHKQPQFGPVDIGELGFLQLSDKGISGGGLKFFYSQLITGDPVDNIPGLPRKGAVFAYKLLEGSEDEGELFRRVSEIYEEVIGEGWREYYKEQASLLWMIQELDKEGEPVHHTIYDER